MATCGYMLIRERILKRGLHETVMPSSSRYMWCVMHLCVIGGWDDYTPTPFIMACIYGHVQVMDWLFSRGLPQSDLTRPSMYQTCLNVFFVFSYNFFQINLGNHE